mgnify:CR=1 FL=1
MDKYTKFILTVIAVGIIGLNIHFFKDEIISQAHAVESHNHNAHEIYGLDMAVRMVVNKCMIDYEIIMCW